MVLEIRGQVAIWVILGVILAATIILFFLISPDSRLIKPAESEGVFDAQSFLEVCSTQYVNEVVDLMLPHGGFVNPNHTVYFNNTNIEFICYNQGFYEPCIQQHPLLLNEMRDEIDRYVTPRIDSCFREMQESFAGRIGNVEYDTDFDVAVTLEEDKVLLRIERETSIEKQGETRRFDGFDITVSSPVYNLGRIAMEIENQEANFCNFEFVGYGILYPRYQIKKHTLSSPTDIYVITDLQTGKILNTAVRGCAFPEGI